MHNLTMVSDIHIGAPHNEGISTKDLLRMRSEEENLVLSGDIYDMTNCKKQDAVQLCANMNSLLDIFGRDYVLGNHEAMPLITRGKNHSFQIKEINNKRVLIFHGPGVFIDESNYFEVYYGLNKTRKWEMKDWGRGKWSYFKYKAYSTLFKHRGGYKRPSKEIIRRINLIMDALWCDVAIWGHTHRNCDIKINNRRYINVNKGITKITI